jgi:Heavy-metal resistance protein CzcE
MKQLVIAGLLAGGVAAATPSFALTRADVIGEPGHPATADRTLRVTPDTRYLNVERGETVNLDVNGQRLTWQFDGLGSVLNLSDIARGAPDVAVYVSEPNVSN